MDKMNNLIFVSYFTGIEGMVMSEWAQDKIESSSRIFPKTFVVTSYASAISNEGNIYYFCVPSLSWIDFKWELHERAKKKQNRLSIYMWYPVAATIGRLWDFLFSKISKNSAARWSWAFTALPVVLYLRMRHKESGLFATGGATGGHLLGILANKVSKIPLYFEFQDPLLGSEMIRSKKNGKWIAKLEEIFILKSERAIFVTEAAMKSAKSRHPELENRIRYIYPGAKQFDMANTHSLRRNVWEIEFLHLGTLYGTRNLDNFFKAIDQLRQDSFPGSERLSVRNLGDIYLPNKVDYLLREDFKILESRSRYDALARAAQSDALLLIQHSDSRSHETIPYKTYDYLNLQKRIFSISLNPEISRILNSDLHFVANAASVESIRQSLEKFLTKFDYFEETRIINGVTLEIETQFRSIFQ
jgi:hypothetical protein